MLFIEREEELVGGSVVITATSKHAPAFALRGPAYVWGGLGQLVFADIADDDDEDENKAYVRIDGLVVTLERSVDDSDGDGVLTVESEMGTAFFGIFVRR